MMNLNLDTMRLILLCFEKNEYRTYMNTLTVNKNMSMITLEIISEHMTLNVFSIVKRCTWTFDNKTVYFSERKENKAINLAIKSNNSTPTPNDCRIEKRDEKFLYIDSEFKIEFKKLREITIYGNKYDEFSYVDVLNVCYYDAANGVLQNFAGNKLSLIRPMIKSQLIIDVACEYFDLIDFYDDTVDIIIKNQKHIRIIKVICGSITFPDNVESVCFDYTHIKKINGLKKIKMLSIGPESVCDQNILSLNSEVTKF